MGVSDIVESLLCALLFAVFIYGIYFLVCVCIRDSNAAKRVIERGAGRQPL